MNTTTFWLGKRVFVTGHTGFKGSWLCLWLHSMGARVYGFALEPPTQPSLFDALQLQADVPTTIGDIREADSLTRALEAAQPDIVFHLAAQPLVRESYSKPVDTYAVNVMGTVHLLEAVRQAALKGIPIRAVVNVTSDKCYDNQEWLWGYRERDPLGGADPYSSSKGCSELVTAAYRQSFFHPERYDQHGVAVATARAGNVIGGGDWAKDRLLPDCFRALLAGEAMLIRNPDAVRPWQHVLEPIHGYLMLAEKLYVEGPRYGEAWNFGPDNTDVRTVGWIAAEVFRSWGSSTGCKLSSSDHPHESRLLHLDSAKARALLGWRPKWNVQDAIQHSVSWFKAFAAGENLRAFTLQQIHEYTAPSRSHEAFLP